MRRIIGYLLVAAVVIAGAVWMSSRPGVVSVEWLGWRVETSVPLLLLVLSLGLVMVLWVARLLAGLLALPGGIGRAIDRRRQRRGLEAMGESLSALFAGEFERAHKRASDAEKGLAGSAMGRLLVARAALAGELEAGDAPGRARELHETLLDDPATEMVALRGLVELAEAGGHLADVGAYAARALALSPKAAWAVKAMVAAQVKGAAWAGAAQVLESATKNHVMKKTESGPLIATARLAEVMANPSLSTAERVALTSKAVDADATHVPALAAHAQALAASTGSPKKAQRLLEEAWQRSPHPALATAYLGLFSNDDALQRVNRASHLAEFNPDHLESRVLVAETSAHASLWGQARVRLKEPLAAGIADARLALIMADLEEHEHQQLSKVLPWLRQAIAWGPAAGWQCKTCATRSGQWQPCCPTCNGFATLQWPIVAGATPLDSNHNPLWSRITKR